MPNEPYPLEVAAALYVSISLFLRQLRRSPVPGELTPPEISALERLTGQARLRPAGCRGRADHPAGHGGTLGTHPAGPGRTPLGPG